MDFAQWVVTHATSGSHWIWEERGRSVVLELAGIHWNRDGGDENPYKIEVERCWLESRATAAEPAWLPSELVQHGIQSNEFYRAVADGRLRRLDQAHVPTTSAERSTR